MLELPKLTLVLTNQENNVNSDKFEQDEMNRIEKKVVFNSAIMICSTDSTSLSIRKVADCLADAVGLNVDFSSLAA